MRAGAATPSQVCSAPAWHTHIMGTLWGSPPSVGRRGPPTLQFMVKGGLAWTPRAVCDSGLSPIAQKGGLGSISPSSQSACSEACSPAAHRHGAAFLRGPARCQLPTGTVLRSSEGRLHASCPQARGCVSPRAGSTPAPHGHMGLRSSQGRLDVKCLLRSGVSQPGRQKAPVPAMFSRHLHLPHACPSSPLLPDPSPAGGWNPAGQGWQGSRKEPAPTPSTRQHPWWP